MDSPFAILKNIWDYVSPKYILVQNQELVKMYCKNKIRRNALLDKIETTFSKEFEKICAFISISEQDKEIYVRNRRRNTQLYVKASNYNIAFLMDRAPFLLPFSYD